MLRPVGLSFALIGTLALAGCFPSSMDDAASANYEADGESRSVHLDRADFEDEMQQIAENPTFEDAFRDVLGESSEGKVSSQLASGWLSLSLAQGIFDVEFDARDLAVDDSTLAQARREAAKPFVGQSGDLWVGLDVLDGFDEDFRNQLIAAEQRELALRDDLGGPTAIEEPTAAEVEEFSDANGELIDSCPTGKYVETIVVSTSERAETVLDELAAGEDFSTLSADYGGGSGCVPEADEAAPDPLLDAALDAELDEVVGPFEGVGPDGNSVLYLLQVSDFATAQLRQQRRADVDNTRTAAFNAALDSIYENLKVKTDPRYGSWDPEQATVVAPVAPAPRSQREPEPAAPEDAAFPNG